MHGRNRGHRNASGRGADKGRLPVLNAHKTIYIIKPEFNSNSQIMFKDNFRPMLNGKNVILLTATVTTGLTINKGIEGIQYYGGIIQSVSAVFSALDEMNGIPIKSVFGKRELRIICSAITATVRSARKERSWMR